MLELMANNNSLNRPPLYRDETIDETLDIRSVMAYCYEVDEKIKAIDRGASLFELLNITAGASREMVRSSYAAVARRFHPTAQGKLSVYKLDLNTELKKITNTLSCLMSEFENSINSVGGQPGEVQAQQSRQEIMAFCYAVESKLALIKTDGTYYQILEVEKDADRTAILTAYACLSARFATTRQAELSAYGLDMTRQLAEICAELKDAYETLSNTEKRNAYNDRLARQLRRDTGKLQQVAINQARVTQPLKAASVTGPLTAMPVPPCESAAINCQPDRRAITGKSRALTAMEFYLRGIELCDEGAYDRAVEALKTAVEIAPKDATYWAQLAQAYSRIQGCSRQAEAAYQEAMKQDPDNGSYPLELGRFYLKFGLQTKATNMFNRAVELDPRNLTVIQSLGIANTTMCAHA